MLLVVLAGCWRSHAPEPARWRTSRSMSALLPDGEWLLAGADFDTTPDPKKDPKAVKTTEGGCSAPMAHFAVAVYADTKAGFLGRGVFDKDAMLDCIAATNKKASRSVFRGHDAVMLGDTLVALATDSGLFMVGSEPVVARALADPLRPAEDEPAMKPLIAKARAIGPIWIAGRIPKDVAIVDDILDVIGAKLGGHVTSVVAGIHFSAPFKIEMDFDLEQAADAQLFATALGQKLQWIVSLDAKLKPVVDTLAIHVDGTHVQVIGTPATIDWLEAFSGLLGAIGAIKNQLENGDLQLAP